MNPRIPVDGLLHEHVYLGKNHDDNTRRTLLVVALTAVMMIGEIIAGFVFGSMALLADGFHMATHACALAIAAGAYVYARRHAHDPNFSFGTGKVGDLAGFASALVLAMVALGIGVESAIRLFEPHDVAFGEATIVAVLGLAVNLASALLLSGHGHAHHGHGHAAHGHAHPHHDHDHDHGEHAHPHDQHDHPHADGHGHDHAPARHEAHGGHDNNLRSAFLHVLADALTSVLAIAALLSGRYLGWVWLDPVMGIVGAVVIAWWSWTLLRDTAGILLDRSDAHLAHEVREAVEAPGDARVTDLHVWRIGPGGHAAIVSYAGTAEPETLRSRLRAVHELVHLTVEPRRA